MGILAKLSQAHGGGAKDNFLRNLTLTTPLNSPSRFPYHPVRPQAFSLRERVLVCPARGSGQNFMRASPFSSPIFPFPRSRKR